jgi:uracil-DNA glycosylase
MPDERVIEALPTIIERLKGLYPDARYELDWENPLQLLVATILAAQCTDERVNKVTPALFAKYPDAQAFADADTAELEEMLRPTGFFREKAKKVQGACRDLVERYGGEVPADMDAMLTLFGVARKTANVVLNNAFNLPTGIIVDTHVHRVSQRMGLTDSKTPEKIERDLMNLVPRKEWIFFGPAMVLLGRYTCTYHAPNCAGCAMNDLCAKRIEADEDDIPPEASPPEEQPTAKEDAAPMATKKTKPTAKKKPAATRSKPASKTAAAVPSLREHLPADWQTVLADEFARPYFQTLSQFVAEERAAHTVFPPDEDLFSAFRATPFERVKVVLLGQDPYHDDGQAHGMSFSVKPGVKPPPSVVNMLKELQDDLGITPVSHGYLASWANQGVLLLNTVLTVRAHEAGSHQKNGWETFTDAVIRALNQRARPAVFLLWGKPAQEKAALIDTKKHRVLPAGHPSPLSAKKGFFGSKPYSSANKALQELGVEPVQWQLPADPTAPLAALPAPAASAAPTPTPAAKPTTRRPEPSKPVPAAAPAAVTAPVPADSATVLESLVPLDWRRALESEIRKPYFKTLDKFLSGEWGAGEVCPAKEEIFRALQLTPLEQVRVVVVGVEPQADGSAEGLSYSVRPEVEPTPVLQALFRSLRQDLGCRIPITGSLVPWTRQGVLLLNSILTVRAGKAGSHKDKGWETFTDAVLKVLNAREAPVVFALWGQQPQKKRALITNERHAIVTAENPEVTPDKFADAQVFSTINHELEVRGHSGIYWQLPYA